MALSLKKQFITKHFLQMIKTAGSIALETRQCGLKINAKTSNKDIVTNGDFAVTNFLKKNLKQQFNDISFIDEETKGTHKKSINKSGFYAVIDPIDGTLNYAEGKQNWAISVGIIRRGYIVAGAIYMPDLDKMFYAEKSFGAFLNSKRIYTSNKSEFLKARVYYDFPCTIRNKINNSMHMYAKFFVEKLQTKKPKSLKSAVCGLMMIAEGTAECYFHDKINPWDATAALCIISEAGGNYTNLFGKQYKLFESNLCVTNGCIAKKDIKPFFDGIRFGFQS